LSPTSASVIMVDNGNGTGPAQLDRQITVVSGSGDPLALGVGWGAGFKFAGNVIKVNTPCNGTQDDTDAIQAGISSASASGGVVQLPAGTCRVTKTLTMESNVVLQGAGKGVTILSYETNYPIFARGCDLVGIEDFTIVNSGAATQGLLWEQNTRSFIQRVTINMGVTQQLFFTDNINMVVSQTDFIQGGSIGGQGPYLFNASSGLVFSNNTSTTIDGSPSFQKTHDALFINNLFTRNAANQNENPVVVTHGFTMDFAYRIAVIGNTFDVINGPITNKTRNDGETLLTEGGGSARTENSGTVASATSTTISDPSNTINVNPFGTGTTPENYGVAIVNGTGAGQTRELMGYSNNTMTVDHPWDVVPDSTSHYATFVWGLEKSILKGNTLTDNPRGIWLYQTAVREVDILGNTITNGGGIFLRTFENEGSKQFDPIYNVRIRNNTISNSNGLWMSYVTVVFVNRDTTNFGIADIGIEVRGTNLTANIPNVTSSTEDYASQEGFMNLMRSETSGGQLSGTPKLLGTTFQGDQCVNCSYPFIIGTGAYGTNLINNQPPPSTPNFLSNWQTLGSSFSGALDTVIQ
jgi:Pectate lyase superfamily protein